MGKWEDTKKVYQIGEDEKIIPEKDKMGLVQAMKILHGLQEAYESCDEVREAFGTIFEWMDNAKIYSDILGIRMKNRVNLGELTEVLGYLELVCNTSEVCSECLLYDREEEETACLLCKAQKNSLADNIVAAYTKIGGVGNHEQLSGSKKLL